MPAKQLEANVRQEPGVAVIDTNSPDLREYEIGAPDPERPGPEAHPSGD
jgi:hypothetical protein